ncbi:hypothetical protein ACFL4V_00235 [Candidatus Latescibacterota bacterium]
MRVISWFIEKGSRRRRKRTLFHMLWIFLASRIAYFLMGVRFNDSWIREGCMTLIPYELLHTDLFSSIWHFHVQPPLFNLLCGIVVKIFGDSHTVAFHGVYLITGLALLAALYTLMVSLGVPYRFAACLAIFFVLSPESILYENLILYPHLVAMLIVISCVSLHQYISTFKWQWGAATFLLWSTIMLTRSMFHLIWFLVGVIIIITLSPRIWKRTMIIAAIPFLLAFGWYAKNYVLFGQFTSSTWLGMNMSRVAVSELTEEEKIALAREGEVSEFVFLRPFPGFWQFSGNVNLPATPETGVKVLDYRYNENKLSNYNNIVFPCLSKQFQKDSFAIIRNYPAIFLFRSLRSSFGMFFAPSNTWFSIDSSENAKIIQSIIPIWNAVFYGDFSKDPKNIGWFILGVYASVIGYWLMRLIRSIPKLRKNTPFFTVVMFMLMTVLYVTLVGNLFELGENMRFHYNIDPLVLTLFALMLVRSVRKII